MSPKWKTRTLQITSFRMKCTQKPSITSPPGILQERVLKQQQSEFWKCLRKNETEKMLQKLIYSLHVAWWPWKLRSLCDDLLLIDLQWCSSSPQAWYWWWAAILKFNKSDEVYNCLPRNKMQIKIQSWCNADGEVGRCFLHIITARQRLLKIPNWFQKT